MAEPPEEAVALARIAGAVGDSPPSEETALARLAEAAEAMVGGVESALSQWAVREVSRILAAWGRLPADTVEATRVAAAEAGAAAGRRVAAELAELLAADPDEQRSTPLEIVRTAVAEPTAVLQAAGVPEVVRDEFAERTWPHDVYGLVPRTMRDLDEDLAAVHFAWGLARATLHRARHRADS